LTELKERGWLTVGLDSEGETDLAAATLREPLALVLGAEGKGLRALTRETCDIRARLILPGVLKSLNVSNAAAVALYAATQQSRNPETARRRACPPPLVQAHDVGALLTPAPDAAHANAIAATHAAPADATAAPTNPADAAAIAPAGSTPAHGT